MRKRNPYDTIPYPSTSFPQTHPDRLAVIAGLHGLSAPDITTARVLEIGGGDGFNLIALAAAWPNAYFHSFDLSGEAVARGQALAQAAGLANIRIEQTDIMDVTATMAPASYDYIIAHGVYAWVPSHVRAAIMALAGRALAPDGIFFVSYNAMPGGHVRQIMRDMLLHVLMHIETIEGRIAAARRFLTDYAVPQEGDDAVVTAMRAQAVAMLGRPDAVLFHDELGDCYAPQYLSEVIAAAGDHGLEFLGDAGIKRLNDGFLPADIAASDDPTAQIVQRAQADDFSAMRFFRQSIFVRSGRRMARSQQVDRVVNCHAAGLFSGTEDGGIRVGEVEFVLRDAELMRRLLDMGATWPAYHSVSTLACTIEEQVALVELYSMGLLHLSTAPAPFSLTPPERPMASALARAQIALGADTVTTLHFEQMRLDDPAARTFILLLDGTRDHEALSQAWTEIPHDPTISIEQALHVIARQRLMLP